MNRVELTGRAGAIFVQGKRRMRLDGELMASGYDWVLYSASVSHWSDGVEATPEEKDEVVRQVIQLLAKEGVRVHVD